MRSIILLLGAWCLSTIALGQEDILGKWHTIDDETSEVKSVVDIYDDGGKILGKIVKIFPDEGEDPDPVCDKCDKDDSRYNQKIIGMVIMTGMQKDGNEYNGGKILDPENGNVYRCKIWVEDSKLKVRGYWGFFYRTQSWIRSK